MVTLTTRQQLELRRLRVAYVASLPERVQAIEPALQDVVSTDGLDGERIDALFHLVHRLCGSAGIYGQPAIHTAAGAFERALAALRCARAESSSGPLDDLRGLVQALRRAAAEAGSAPVTAPEKSAATKRGSRPRSRRNVPR